MSNKGKSTDKVARKAPTKNQVQRQKPATQTAPTELGALHGPVDSAAQLSPADLNDLQQTYGNSYVQRVSRHSSAVNPSAGKSSRPAVQRSDDMAEGGDISEELESRIQGSQGSGHALPDDLRGQMEGQLGAGFEDVTLHTDNEADALNRSLKAEAFTVGSDIYFRKDTYNPGSPQGQQLLAHELTHVVQQGASQPQPEAGAGGASPNGTPSSESEAANDSVEQAKEEQKDKADELRSPEQEKEAANKETQNEVIPEEQKEEKSEDDEQQQEEEKKQAKVPGPEAAEQAAGASASDLAEQKFETVADQEADSDIRPLLPTWSELAEGTVQLSADQTEELDAHASTTTTAGDSATAVEDIDQSALANDALKEGVVAGLQEGAANLVMSTLMQLVATKVPVADGLMAGAALVSDPEGWWKEEGIEGQSKRFMAIGKAFGSIADEDNDWGRAAAFFEGVIAIVEFASRLINTMSNVLSIIYAVAFPLSFAPFIGPFFTAIVSYISPLLPPLGTITLKLDITKMVLSLLAAFLRYMDMLETNADPQKLLEKQAKLQKHVQTFVAEAVTQGGEKTKDKAYDSYQKHKVNKVKDLPDAHPDKIHVVEKYDYKGQDTVAELTARQQARQDIADKKAAVKAKERDVAQADDAHRPQLEGELRQLKTEYADMKANHVKRQERAAAEAEYQKTKQESDDLVAQGKPEDQKLLDKELKGLRERTERDENKGWFYQTFQKPAERWNMHRKARGEAAMAGANAREAKRDYESKRSKLADPDGADGRQRSDVATAVDAARLDTTTKKQTERESHNRLVEAQDTHKRRAQREKELNRHASQSETSSAKHTQTAADSQRRIEATDRRIAELESRRSQTDDTTSIDAQIGKLRSDRDALVARKQKAEADAITDRDAAAQFRQEAQAESQRVEAARQQMELSRQEYEARKQSREEAESTQKQQEDTLKYLDAKEKWKTTREENEKYVLTSEERSEYESLKRDLKDKAERTPPEPITADEAKRMRYLERMAQWEKRSKRSFSGQNKDYWDAKRYVQYRFGGLEAKEWIAKALPGGDLAQDGDWAKKYGAGAIQVNVNLFTIRQATEPTAAEAEGVIDAQRNGKGKELEDYAIKVKPASGNEFDVEPKKTAYDTPIDYWRGNKQDSTPTVMVKPGDATVTASQKSGAKPTATWADGEDVSVAKGETQSIQVDYFKFEEDAGATTPVLRREDPAALGEPAGIQRRAEVTEEESGGNSGPIGQGADLNGFLEMLLAVNQEMDMDEDEIEAFMPSLELDEETEAAAPSLATAVAPEEGTLDELLPEETTETEPEAAAEADMAADDVWAEDETVESDVSDWPIDPANGLPMPPYETFDQMSALAYTHRQLEAARLDQEATQEIGTMMALDAESQAKELAGTRGMVQANQTAIALHNQDIDEKLAAQKEMEQASAGEQGSAQQGQQQSGQGHDIFSAMFMPLLTAMGIGQAHAGTGDQKGSVNETKDGMGQQAEAGRAGVELTSMGVAVSKQRQNETLRAQQQTRFEEKRLRDLDARLAADQDKALEGQEEFAMLTDGSGGTQDEIIAEQDSLTETYAEANDYAQSWADEHYAVRQELFGDLESELDE